MAETHWVGSIIGSGTELTDERAMDWPTRKKFLNEERKRAVESPPRG